MLASLPFLFILLIYSTSNFALRYKLKAPLLPPERHLSRASISRSARSRFLLGSPTAPIITDGVHCSHWSCGPDSTTAPAIQCRFQNGIGYDKHSVFSALGAARRCCRPRCGLCTSAPCIRRRQHFQAGRWITGRHNDSHHRCQHGLVT